MSCLFVYGCSWILCVIVGLMVYCRLSCDIMGLIYHCGFSCFRPGIEFTALCFGSEEALKLKVTILGLAGMFNWPENN